MTRGSPGSCRFEARLRASIPHTGLGFSYKPKTTSPINTVFSSAFQRDIETPSKRRPVGTVPLTHIDFHMTYLQAGPFRLTSKEINQKTLCSFRHRSLFSSPPPPSKKLELVQKKKKKNQVIFVCFCHYWLSEAGIFILFFYLCTPQTLLADMRTRTDSSCFVGT